MGLDMYLYAEKYKSDFIGGCEYPTELGKFACALEHRSPKSVNAKYKIGYWRKDWDVHEAIMANAGTKTENTADLTIDDMTAIVDALEALKADAEREERERELDYSIALFKDAIRLAGTERYDITYYASW